jgi:hypothetical protein
MIQTNVVEKLKTHTGHSAVSFLKSYPSWVNVEKYGTAIQATGDNMGLMLHRKDAICMPDN